ncbi:hypothetical protein HC928_02910 [bacterium]|nr:hypothetical protein [bacterium]
MTLFSDIIEITQMVKSVEEKVKISGVFIGRIAQIDSEGKIKVNAESSVLSPWLSPTSFLSGVKDKLVSGMIALYCFPNGDLEQGTYFSILDDEIQLEGGLTEENIDQIVDAKIDLASSDVRAWATSQFVDQAFLTAQNYTTLTVVQTWVNAQSYANQSFVNSQFLSRYHDFSFFNHAVGNVVIPTHWLNRRINLSIANIASGTPNLVINAANNNWFGVNTRLYLRNTTGSSNISVQGLDGVLVNGSTAAFVMAPQKQYDLRKADTNTRYTITEIPYNQNPY